MLVPLLSATSTAAWAAPDTVTTEGTLSIPGAPPWSDAAAGLPMFSPQTAPVNLFLMGPMLDGIRLPQVVADFNLVELRGIEGGSLELALGSRIAAAKRVELKRQMGNFVSVARLQELGIIATYDPINFTLNLALVPDAALAKTLPFIADDTVGPAERHRSAELARGGTGDRIDTQDFANPQGHTQFAAVIDSLAGERKGQLLFGNLVDLADAAHRSRKRESIIGLSEAKDPALHVAADEFIAGESKATLAVPENMAAAEEIAPVSRAPLSPEASPDPALVPPLHSQPTPRVSRITMHPVLDGSRLPLVTAELTIMELRAIDAASLELALGPKLAPAQRTQLKRETGNFLPVARLQELGIIANYDPASLTIKLALAPEAVAPQSFSFISEVDDRAGERVQPADVALGVTGNLIGSRDFSRPAGDTKLLFNFAGFANIGGRENGGYLLFGGLVDLANNAQRRFERDRLIAFKDFEGPALRLAAGDLIAGLPVIAGEADVAGISLERRYDTLQPLRNIRPTGRRQFVLERPARIEIYANGALVQAIDVNAGLVDLNRIPALSLSTDIQIIIEDATGRREIDSFTLANDIELLAAGLSEFNVTAGLMRKPSSKGFAYSATPLLTGQFVRGLNDTLTAGGHFALMEEYQNGGLTVASLAPGGAVFLGGSMSNDMASGDVGYALSLAYRGDPFQLSDLDSQLNVRLDYRSADYRRLSQTLIADPIKFDIALDYRLSLTERVAVSLGGNYLESHVDGPATRAVFGGVQVALGRVLASATARYANIGGRSDQGVLATLTIPLGRNHFSTASFDSVSQQARLEARRVRDITVPEFDYGVIVERSPLFDRLTGQARFANSRFNLDVEMMGSRAGAASGLRDQNVVNFRLQSGLAFADGTLGIGRNPGRGFVIVDRHPSLKDTSVEVETSGVGRRAGQTNGLGPAVVSQLSGYRPDNIRVSVLDAPPGYDIGPGEYLSDPGALSGVKLKIGSDAYRSALVTFLMPDGSPVKLADGIVRNIATGETGGVFTNSAGRAVLPKLAEGRYRVELVDGDLIYEFTVGESDPAIIKLGTQTMEMAP